MLLYIVQPNNCEHFVERHNVTKVKINKTNSLVWRTLGSISSVFCPLCDDLYVFCTEIGTTKCSVIRLNKFRYHSNSPKYNQLACKSFDSIQLTTQAAFPEKETNQIVLK